MFRQTDKRLGFTANEDCFVFIILKIIEELIQKRNPLFKYTYKQIRKIRKVAVKAGFFEQDGWINEKGISGIGVVASGVIGEAVYIRRVGANDNFNFIIGRFSRYDSNGILYYHFVLMDSENKTIVEWDPWSEKGSRAAREGKLSGFRYIFAEVV